MRGANSLAVSPQRGLRRMPLLPSEVLLFHSRVSSLPGNLIGQSCARWQGELGWLPPLLMFSILSTLAAPGFHQLSVRWDSLRYGRKQHLRYYRRMLSPFKRNTAKADNGSQLFTAIQSEFQREMELRNDSLSSRHFSFWNIFYFISAHKCPPNFTSMAQLPNAINI